MGSVLVPGMGIGGQNRLSAVAEILRQESRGSGMAIRQGKAEFLLVLPQADMAAAEAVIERVHQRLSEKMEISAGLAQYHPAMETPDHLVDAARRSLRGIAPQPGLCLDV